MTKTFLSPLKRANRYSTFSWLLLMAATALTWFVGEHNVGSMMLTLSLLSIAYIKGSVVILDFMALSRAPLLWRVLTLGWLALVCGLIGLAYWIGIG